VEERRPFRSSDDGTEFCLYPQSRRLGFGPTGVRVAAPPGSIGPGPSDAIADTPIEVIDALDKESYHDDETGRLKRWPRPPYRPGEPRVRRPAAPVGGHFRHLKPRTRSFSAAATYAAIRFTLEVWQHYLERRVRWHFADAVGPVLQVHPRVNSTNSWSGDGFLEFGFPEWPFLTDPDCENFEIVAHETGHLIMKSVIGTMPDDEKSLQHRAHEEAAADLVALLACLHFAPVVRHVLEETGGYLFLQNVLARTGEWGRGGKNIQRTALNDATMQSVRARRDLNKHQLSAPFTGAVYDLLVGIFVHHLRALDAIPDELARACWHVPGTPVPDLADRFAKRYGKAREDFHLALGRARDDLARLLAHAWYATPKHGVVYGRVLSRLLDADAALGTGHARLITDAFAQRGIVPAGVG
jgi:hypothetical protein